MYSIQFVVVDNSKVQINNNAIATLLKAKQAILDKENERNFNQAYNATSEIAKVFKSQDTLVNLLAIGVAHEAKLHNERQKAIQAIDVLIAQKGTQIDKKTFDALIEGIAKVKILMAAADVQLVQKLYQQFQKLYLLSRLGEQLTDNVVSKIVLLALRSKAQQAFQRYSFLNN